MASELEILQAEMARRQAAQQAPMPVNPASPQDELAILEQEMKRRQQAAMPEGNAQSAVYEPALTLATGLVGEVAGGGRAIYGAATGDPDIRSSVEETRDAFTFKPRTKSGQQTMSFLGELLQPVGDALEATEEFLGDAAYDTAMALGLEGYAPVAGAAATSIPTLALELLGLTGVKKGAKVAAPVVKKAGKMADDMYNGVEGTIRRLAGDPKLKIYDDGGMFTPETIEFLRKKADDGIDVDVEIARDLEKSGILTADQAEMFNLFKRQGIEPTRANITQTTDDWRIQQDLMKESGDLSQKVANQDAMLAARAREGKASIGSVTDDLPSTNANIYETINDIAETADNAVTAAYKAAREAAPEAKNINLSGFVENLRKMAPENTASGGTIAQIRGILADRGVMPKGKWKVEGKIDVQTAEKIRQELNRLWGEASDGSRGSNTTRRIISDLKDSLDNDVATVVGDDVFFNARQAKKQFHDLIEIRKSNKFDASTTNLLEDILYNKVPQDKIMDKIIKTNRPEDFAHLQEFFLEKAGDAGIATWNNIKATYLEDAIEAALGAKTEGGISSFNGRTFKKRFEVLKTTKAGKGKNAPTRYEAMFSPEERQLIDDIIAISEARTPVKSVFAGSGPSGYAINRAIEALLDKAPIPGTDWAARKVGTRRMKQMEKRALNPPTKTIEAEAVEMVR